MRTPLLETCQTRYLLADGGISTALRQMTGDPALVAETLSLENPELVLEMHNQFYRAGAQVLTTNTFAANPSAGNGLDHAQADNICRTAAHLARRAAGPDGFVLGSVGPWCADNEDWKQPFSHQLRALADSGVDAIVIETVTSLDAARKLAQEAVHHCSHLPVILSFSFKKTGFGTFELPGDGAPLGAVADELHALGTQGYGLNCGAGMDAYDYTALVAGFREKTDQLLFARPSAGDPHPGQGELPRYPDSAEYMAEAIWGIVRAGANIVGGCCGVTPEHIAAFRNEMDMLG